MRIVDVVLNLIFPRRCPYCDKIVTLFGEGIHTECLKKMKLLAPPYCMKCGRKTMRPGGFCSNCENEEKAFIRGRCLYEYKAVANSIYRFKYFGRREYAKVYAEEAADYLKDFFKEVSPDALAPIPIHRKRYAKRGYNQAYELAKEISKITGIPVLPNLLKRRRNTAPLKLLGPQERQKNLKNAFIVGQNSVKLKTIILIDDIYTTGATMNEAAKALHGAGIPDVYFVALAGGKSI